MNLLTLPGKFLENLVHLVNVTSPFSLEQTCKKFRDNFYTPLFVNLIRQAEQSSGLREDVQWIIYSLDSTLTPKKQWQTIYKVMTKKMTILPLERITTYQPPKPANMFDLDQLIELAKWHQALQLIALSKHVFNDQLTDYPFSNSVNSSSYEIEAAHSITKKLSVLKLDNILKLNLEKLDLIDVPSEISFFTQLTFLDLNNNKIDYLPETIGQLVKVTMLDLYNNKIVRLPESFKNLTELEELGLDKNFIKELPTDWKFEKLKYLGIEETFITQLPENFKKSKKITVAGLFDNKLKKIFYKIIGKKFAKNFT